MSNAIAPFATVYGLWEKGVVVTEEPIQLWLLAFGGLGIVVGLAVLGYKVIRSIGVDMSEFANASPACLLTCCCCCCCCCCSIL